MELLMKFLCDEMLGGLGKWLRIAGYDTKIIKTNMSDQEILETALKENRTLLTRDKHFLEMKVAGKKMIYLTSNSLEDCIRELNASLELDWLYLPFSRCLICNSLLVEPDSKIILQHAPVNIRSMAKKFWYCKECKKVYWEGSHTERMLKQLQFWQSMKKNF
jgi:uncharacterized protein